MPAGATRRDQSAAPQHRQMFGERWLRYAKGLAKLQHRMLALAQKLENASARWVSHCPKNPILLTASHGAE